MTKDSMQMQNTYFSAVEGFRQFIRNSVRTEKDHYRWVDLYSEKGLDDPNPKVVEIQDEKAEQLAVACATLAYLTLSVYYGRNKFADTTFAELEGEDYSKFLRQAHYEMADEHGQFGIFGWDGLITQIAKDCMPDKYVGDNKKASLVYTNMYWSVYNAMKSLKDGKSIRRMIDALLDDGDKIGNLGYSASVKNSINCVIINYSQTAQAVYIGFFVADRVTYEYIEERSFNTFIKNEKRIRGFSYSKDGILYGHSTPRAKPKEFNPSFSMYFATKETKHWPCTMKDLFSIHTYDGLFESVVYFIMLFFGETNPLWKDLAKDYTEQSAYSAIPLTVIDESHSKRELIAKYYGEDKAFKRNNKEPIGYGIFLARASNVVKPEQLQKLFGYDPGYISIGRAKNDLVKPLARYIYDALPENEKAKNPSIRNSIEDAIVMNNNRRQLIPISFTSVKKIREWHDNIIPIGTYVTTGKMKIKKDSKFKNLKLPKDCVRLTTTRQMVMEGNFQHNCVATYISKVNKDECSIWSQRKPDGTRNTIEIGIEHGKYCIIQMCAFANQEPMQKDLEKVQKAIDKCNDRRNKECLRKSV